MMKYTSVIWKISQQCIFPWRRRRNQTERLNIDGFISGVKNCFCCVVNSCKSLQKQP